MRDQAEILKHYLAAALWTAELEGSRKKIAQFSIDQAKTDIDLFVKKTESLLDASELADEQIGHDFWLTRNGHGTGFWDRGLGNIGVQLSATARDFKELNVFKEKKEIIIE